MNCQTVSCLLLCAIIVLSVCVSVSHCSFSDDHGSCADTRAADFNY